MQVTGEEKANLASSQDCENQHVPFFRPLFPALNLAAGLRIVSFRRFGNSRNVEASASFPSHNNSFQNCSILDRNCCSLSDDYRGGKAAWLQPDGSGGFLGLALLDDQPTNQGGWRDIKSKDLTLCHADRSDIPFQFSFLGVKSAGPE